MCFEQISRKLEDWKEQQFHKDIEQSRNIIKNNSYVKCKLLQFWSHSICRCRMKIHIRHILFTQIHCLIILESFTYVTAGYEIMILQQEQELYILERKERNDAITFIHTWSHSIMSLQGEGKWASFKHTHKIDLSSQEELVKITRTSFPWQNLIQTICDSHRKDSEMTVQRHICR